VLPEDYFLEIEARFAERRGTPFIFSAKDWALMQAWHGEGIPLAVVIEALDSVFDKNEASGRRKVISSLSYCRHAVKELWTDRKELLVGGQGEVPEASPGPALALLALRMEERAGEIGGAVGEVLLRAAGAVRAMPGPESVPRIESALMDLEHSLITDLLAALDDEQTASIQRDVAEALRGYGSRDEAMRRRTEEANLRRVVRDRLGLPRLTLFG
jgi:hypothetical protein